MFEIDKGMTNFICGMANEKDIDSFIVASSEPIIGICMVGRSNVGKSTLINSLFGKKMARTSNTPGRTREINMFDFYIKNTENKNTHKFFLFDLPGYGHAEVSKQLKLKWEQLMLYFFERLPQTTLLVNIQDARNPSQSSDIQFQNFIKNFGLNTILAFNKIDKLKKQKERAALNNLKPQILKDNKWMDSIFFISAEKKTGLKPMEETIKTRLVQMANIN